jgi:aminopeptidase N
MISRCVLGVALAGGGLGSGAAAAAPPADFAPLQSGLDYHSFANIEQFRMTRLELDLRVDSSQKVLTAVAGLSIKRLNPAATDLVVDTRDLNILGVSQKAQDVLGATAKSETTWVSRPYHLERKDPILGQALVIELPPSKRPSELIRIEYETSPTTTALQWLSAEQTKHKPFVYTTSEPIGARGWIPLQDTPQVRFTFKAIIHTSPDVLAVMSAGNDPKVKRNGEYSFVMRDAIPSYAIALAVGDLKFQETGPRTGVYAQRSLLKEAAQEFAETESMIEIAERLAGPYRWERFDIAVLPRSLPVGGIGNPRLSFISATVLAGDKSLVSVVAQAVAHAWAGNLVGNATWRDLWLNDGLAAYLAGRIMSVVHGEAAESIALASDLRALRHDLTRRGPADQALAVDLRDRDPQEAYTRVPDEKGRLFFAYLDSRFGRDRFDGFLRGYFEHFAFQSISTEQFVKYLQENLLDRFPDIVTPAQVADWIYGPGIPPGAVLPPADALAPVDAVRASWESGGVAAKNLPVHAWLPLQWMYFLDGLPPLSAARLKELDQAFGSAWSANAEIGARWFALVIRSRYQPGFVGLEAYLLATGQRQLILPLYEELMKSPAGAAQARRVFKLARGGYHPAVAAAVDATVNPPSDEGDAADEQ